MNFDVGMGESGSAILATSAVFSVGWMVFRKFLVIMDTPESFVMNDVVLPSYFDDVLNPVL